MLGIKKNLSSEIVFKSNTTESINCKMRNLQKSKPPVIVDCIYRRPDADLNLCQTITKEILDLKTKFKKSTFFIGGDFKLAKLKHSWQ